MNEKVRKFAFGELAYAIVVAAAYGLIIGIYITTYIDFFIRLPLYIIFWVLFICLHLAGIYLLVKLENHQKKTNEAAPRKTEPE
ncbi:MAG: hypothetical protein ACFFB5_13235 [Promethearchaeota archaeon]